MKRSKLLKYMSITFAVTYMCWGGLAVLIQAGILSFSHPIATFLHLVGGFGPPIAAVFVFDTKISAKAVLKAIFGCNKKTSRYLWAFVFFETIVIALSSMEFNPAVPLYLVPLIFIQAVFIYGGNEELGWRGTMQPLLEEKFPFPIATLITGVVWGIWHLPLWFVDGASQQNTPFVVFLLLSIFLSFFFAAVYKKTKSVFYCGVLHGFTNMLLSMFIIKVNAILIIGLLLILGYSIFLWYSGEKRNH